MIHGCPGEIHPVGLGAHKYGLHVGRIDQSWRANLLGLGHGRRLRVKNHFLVVAQLYRLAARTGDLAGTFFQQDFVVIFAGVILHLGRGLRTQAGGSAGDSDLGFGSLGHGGSAQIHGAGGYLDGNRRLLLRID